MSARSRALRWAIPLAVVPVLALLAYGFRTDPRDIPSPLLGKPASPFALTAFDGQPVSLDALRGKVVVVNFWASWCVPACYDEAPSLERAWQALRPGGILLCYLPTVLQVKNLVDALREDRRFACMETSENLMRFWHFKGMSARPQHRMVAHTGFITSARRLADGQTDIPRAP